MYVCVFFFIKATTIKYTRTCLLSRRLDYDSLADHTYNFTVVATDNGVPALSGSANVRVSVTNVNDEDPVFVQSTVEHIQVSEDALPNTVIHVLQAYDPDGDAVTYSFAGNLRAVVRRQCVRLLCTVISASPENLSQIPCFLRREYSFPDIALWSTLLSGSRSIDD